MRARSAILAALILAAAAPWVRAEDPVEILARAKAAAGGPAWDAVRVLHTQLRISTGGLSGTADSREDLRTGRFVDTFSLGPVEGAEGFDGKVKWSQDPSGQTLADDSGDAREGAANEAYRRSLSYFYPDRRKAAVSYAGRREDGDSVFHVLRLHPEGGRPFEMWLDAGTFLIARVVEQTGRETRTTFLSDYRDVEGLRLPFASRSTNGEVRYDLVANVEKVEFNPPLDEAGFRMPEGRTADFAIAGGKTSATIPFRLLNNHLYVQAEIAGKPLQVLFDTGGANVLTPATARRLGIETEGALQGRGVGEKSEDLALARVRELKLGDVTLTDQVFYVLPLAGVAEAEGMEVDGIVGYEVLKRLVTRVEYSSGRLTLTLPEAFLEPANGRVVPFTFDGQHPQVEGEVDGLRGKFTIDTGSRASLTLSRPFAEEHGLRQKYPPRFEALSGWGVGGGVRSAFTRVGVLKLGDVEVPSPVTDIALSEKGALANRYLAGNVGGGVLKRFDVTFDYGGKRLIFEANADFSRPDSYDRTGMWLNREGGGLQVRDVVAGGPADEAGLKIGDTIVAIDGRGVGEVLLPDVRARFRESPPATAVRLTVKIGSGTREVTVVLRDLV